MQYILTKQEYGALAPVSELEKLKEKVELLNDKVIELSNYPCSKGISSRSATFYCDDCPIGARGIGTCTKSQQYYK